MLSVKALLKIVLFFIFLVQSNSLFSQPISPLNKYANINLWAAHPDKKDFSDSIPKPLAIRDDNNIKDVDVFFIHPTTYTNKSFSEWNASLKDSVLNNKTDRSTILYQASVFNESCRVYAPRYRQAHIQSFFIDQNIAKQYFDTAYQDIREAFLFYLEHYNNDRPIIIAAHSQGTVHAARLLKEFFDNKPLYKKLVCAYIIGMPVPENYFNNIPVCENSNQTGCFVSWRTFKDGYIPDFVKKEKEKMAVVNPLTWERNCDKVSSKKNLGGILKNFNKIVPRVVSTRIHGNVLWSSKPNMIGKILLVNKNYHIGDINLFYLNIRENIKERIKNYKPN